MLKIWGRKNSVNVKKALWAAEELGLKYERIDAGMEHGVTKTPEYLKMNPTSLVPTIDDDGFVLWESHTIVRYFAAKHGMGMLCPTDPKARAGAERWMDWTYTFSREFQRPVFWPLVRTPPESRDMKAINEAIGRCAELLKVPETYLSKTRYLSGDAFTMGDIPLGCHLQLWFRLAIERPKMPGLEAWFQRLLERPAYRKHVDLPPT